MILRFQNIFGVRLFRVGRFQAELWLCPRGEKIPEHAHDKMDSRITFLGGAMIFTRDKKSIPLDWRRIGRSFKVRAGQAHGAEVTGRFGLFLNLERWTTAPSSAATDFRKL